jgi:hypothetical protein
MLFSCYLRDGIVYVPTLPDANRALSTDIEAVAVVPLSNSKDVRRALLETIARKNVIIPDPDPKALRAPPLMLKHAGAKSWPEFFRNASTWSIREDNGAYKIIFYRKHLKKYWEQDLAHEIQFPAGTTVDDVVDRMVAILQEAARQ